MTGKVNSCQNQYFSGYNLPMDRRSRGCGSFFPCLLLSFFCLFFNGKNVLIFFSVRRLLLINNEVCSDSTALSLSFSLLTTSQLNLVRLTIESIFFSHSLLTLNLLSGQSINQS